MGHWCHLVSMFIEITFKICFFFHVLAKCVCDVIILEIKYSCCLRNAVIAYFFVKMLGVWLCPN